MRLLGSRSLKLDLRPIYFCRSIVTCVNHIHYESMNVNLRNHLLNPYIFHSKLFFSHHYSSSSSNDTIKMRLEEVEELCISSLKRAGASSLHAKAITDELTACERDGCQAHGLHRLPAFLQGCIGSDVNAMAMPCVEDISPGCLRVDAQGGFECSSKVLGIPLLAKKALSCGIASMSIINSRGMSNAMWYPAEKLAVDYNLISIVFTNSPAYVAYPGSTDRVFGTNPIAFGWPRANGKPPMVWDQASSVMARGNIEIAKREGKKIPKDVGIDINGATTTDPNKVLEGAQLPFGSYKGANIAMMVELLSAALLGTDLAITTKGKEFDTINRGMLIIALRGDRISNKNSKQDGEQLFRAILQQEGNRLPSDRRYDHRRKVMEEEKLIEISSSLYKNIKKIIPS